MGKKISHERTHFWETLNSPNEQRVKHDEERHLLVQFLKGFVQMQGEIVHFACIALGLETHETIGMAWRVAD